MQFCPRHGCGRAGDDLGDCANFALKCPRPVEVDATKHVVLRCTACDKTRAVSASDIMQGKTSLKENCDRAECACVVLPIAKAKPKAQRSDAPPDDVP